LEERNAPAKGILRSNSRREVRLVLGAGHAQFLLADTKLFLLPGIRTQCRFARPGTRQ
jgi:hypothetical protein